MTLLINLLLLFTLSQEVSAAMIEKIVSGGQTGVDRAALDVAIELDIPHEGWCPKGRLAEGGAKIPEKYNLKETPSEDFSQRTILNIRDSDGTLVIIPSLSVTILDGTVLTINEANRKKKPLLIVNLSDSFQKETFQEWIDKNNIKVLNIAGPRESTSPGIYRKSVKFINGIMKENKRGLDNI